MTKNQDEIVLKGQHNLAQSNALGLRKDNGNRPRNKDHKGKILLSDEKKFLNALGNNVFQFRPQEVILFNNHFLSDGFSNAPFTQGVALG